MKEVSVYYNANTIKGNKRCLLPIHVNNICPTDIEVYVKFKYQMVTLKVVDYNQPYLWLQTNEIPEEISFLANSRVSNTNQGNSFTCYKPNRIHKDNLLKFLELLSLKFSPLL